ncbi:MAG: ATP-binding protein [Lachnospiraceae bacterium]|nr:ATP-binding protein [Lachnospiraceae bacterium]
MLYNIHYALASVIFLIIQFAYLLIQYNKDALTVKRFRELLFFMIIADIGDIITAVTISMSDVIPVWLNYLLNVLYLELTAACISLFPKYIHALLGKVKARTIILDRINNILLLIYAALCASTPITHLVFYFDDNRMYQHGMLYYAVYLMPMYLFIYSFIRLISNKKCFNKKQFYSIIFFIFFSMLGPTLQVLLPDNVLLDFFALSIATFIVISGLETPDFIQLEKALKELNENRILLQKAKMKEEEINKAVHEMTKSASWSLRMDADGNITETYWSDEFFWLLGYERTELDGREHLLWGDSLHPDDAESAMNAFMSGLTGKEAYDIYYRLRSKDGEYKWYRGTGELKSDSDTKGTVFLGIIQDTNDRVVQDALMKERLAFLDELQKSQEALKEALVKAEAADRAKSDFLANMSHEIRTPINAVLGLNELIARESTESNIQMYSSNVADAGNALLSLVNDVLDFSKIEAGRMELAPADYELNILLRECKNMLTTKIVTKGLAFNIKNNPDIPNCLYGDEVRIRQILVNLMNNAVKYTDCGSITLDVDYEQLDDDRVLLKFSVTDTGIGIREEDLPALFESFKRIDLEHNRKLEGSGLGLNIAKSFIELMGGTIDVSSVYGQGSTFTVHIPQLVKGDNKIGVFNMDNADSKKKKYVASFHAPNAKLLIVDDVPINIKVIKGLIRQTQVNIDAAESGPECLEKMATTKYDLVLLDHMMPNMDGVEVMKRLTEDKTHANQDTPIIMLTANAILGAKEEYLELGFAGYLSKPVHPDELEAMIVKNLPAELVELTPQN